jgi:hypothetical protein
MDRNRQFIILGLLSVAALLLVVLFVGYQREDAFAQEADAPRSGPPPILAVTGACGIGAEVGVLYVIDTEKKQLAVYHAWGGRDIRFVAARKIYYDFELIEANDATDKQFSVRRLKQAYEAHKKKKGGEEKKPPRRR